MSVLTFEKFVKIHYLHKIFNGISVNKSEKITITSLYHVKVEFYI